MHSYIVPDWIDDGDVALQCNDENSVGWRVYKNPDRNARDPDATNELVVDAVTWHTSAVHLDKSDYQREERCTEVYDALIDDQNVNRLNEQTSQNLLIFIFISSAMAELQQWYNDNL